jgi:hypothetical protein
MIVGGYFMVAQIYYHKGFKKSGHVCRTDPIVPGTRYKATELKYVPVSCLICGEPIRVEVIIVRSYSDKDAPYSAKLSLTDYQAHIEFEHRGDKELV